MGLEHKNIQGDLNTSVEVESNNNKNKNNEEVRNKINIAISQKFVLDKDTGILDLANKIESDRRQLDKESQETFNMITGQCQLDISALRFDMINEKFGNDQDLESLYKDLKKNLDIDISQTLKAYDDYICDHLILPEGSNMSDSQYNQLLDNVHTIIRMELSKLNKKLLELREDNNGSLEGMQWIINGAIHEALEPVRESVMSSAQFYLEMQNPEAKSNLIDKIGKLHVNMRIREIEESMVNKKLLIHHKDGFFDFLEDSDYTKQIDEIPTDIIKNDSFLTANKVRNRYRDLYVVNNDINNDGTTISQDTAKLEHVSVLNEKDKQTELEYMVSGLALELILALPFVGTGNSIMNSFTGDDINIDFIKSIRPDLDQSYQVETTWGDRLIEIGAAGLGLVGMRSLAKSGKIAEFFERITALGTSKGQLFKSIGKMSGHLGINMEQIQKFFQIEHTASKEKTVFDRSNSSTSDTDVIDYGLGLKSFDSFDTQQIIKFSKLNDADRMKTLHSYFPELEYTQLHDVLEAHKMPGNLFSHSPKEVIAKIRFLIKDAKIPGKTVKKIMDMGLAGEISDVTEMFRLDVPELMKNLKSLPNIKTQDFAIIQNRQFLAGELKETTMFSRDIKVSGETFMTIRATDKDTLDGVANSIKVLKKEQLDFNYLYDKELKGDKIVTDVYGKEALYNSLYGLQST